jgi:hypothetical protein
MLSGVSKTERIGWYAVEPSPTPAGDGLLSLLRFASLDVDGLGFETDDFTRFLVGP